MSSKLSSFMSLSMPLRVGIMIIGGGGVMAGLMVLMQGLPMSVLVFIIVGIILVGFLLVCYTGFLKWLKKRRSKPMEQGVVGAAAGAQTISDPERMARVDDLRRKFEEGISTFQAAGKDLYSLPWYVILGEPGSGKTEAVRHCGVGFPPGLQDQYQGVGGTINMNWWFTDHGVLLDTAGRLIFEEVETGRTSEWKEFLRLLRKYRPNCPINGAMLVIPADSLIKETSEEIERKANFISQQFDVIQRTLDVRFPVYVTISKCDLINGFREFFDNINDPQLQQQIVGWSNPTSLDEPYSPRFVDDHFSAIQERLFQRRLTRLQELSIDDRLDDKPSVDVLYAFPQAMEQIASRLRRYLDLVFQVGSQWACKPLFFRGIYFTSSMQEGAVLDNDLAQTLGIPVESLPEGPVWKKDRAFFLRDLFMRKAFAEKGLVTRATDANKLYRQRRALIMGSALVGVVVLLFITVFGAWRFRRNIGGVHTYLAPAADSERKRSLVIVHKSPGSPYVYRGGERASVGRRERVSVSQYYGELTGQVLDWLDKRGGLESDMEADVFGALNRVYWNGVLQPLLAGVAWRQDTPEYDQSSWDHREAYTQALAQLIGLRAGQPLGEFAQEPGLDALMEIVCPNDMPDYQKDRDYLHDPLIRLSDLASEQTVGPDFMKSMLLDRVETEVLDRVIAQGIQQFNVYWQNRAQHGVPSPLYPATVETLVADLNDFYTQEMGIQAKYRACRYDSAVLSEWAADFNDLQRVSQRLSQNDTGGAVQGSLWQTWEQANKKHTADLETGLDLLLQAFSVEDINTLDPFLRQQYEVLYSQQLALLDRFRDPSAQERVRDLDRNLWTYVQGQHLYQKRFTLYEDTAQLLPEKWPSSMAFAELHQHWERMRDALAVVNKDMQVRANSDVKSEQFEAISKTLSTVVACFSHQLCFQVADEGIDGATPVIRRLIDSEQADPNQMRNALAGLHAIRAAIDGLAESSQKQPLEARYAEIVRYAPDLAHDYRAFWFGTRLQEVTAQIATQAGVWEHTWPEQRNAMGQLRSRDVMRPLEQDIGVILQQASLLASFPDGALALEAIEKNLQEADRYYLGDCEKVCERWHALSVDALAARESLLDLNATEFGKNYFVYLPGSEGDLDPRLVDKFWYRLSHWTLEQLVEGVSRQLQLDLANARKDSLILFPLSPHIRDELTLNQYRSLRHVVDQTILCDKADRFPADTLGSGAEVASPEVDLLLEKLRHPINVQEQSWLKNAIHVITHMPPLRDRYWVRVMVEQADAAVARRIVLRWGQEEIIWRDWGSRRAFDDDIQVLPYDSSGESLVIACYRNLSADNPSQDVAFHRYPSGPEEESVWPWHRLVSKFPGKRPGQVVLSFPDTDQKPIVLRLEFFEDEACTRPFTLFPPSP